jgi:proteasome lid subunit RPN8/RPN11
MAVLLRQKERKGIEQAGAEAYPNECCGMLLGKDKDGRKVVSDIVPLRNARDDSPRNRFLILPEDFVRADREARQRELDILGFYHSHPDHPARPSEFDRQHAWPWYTYIILAVEKGLPRELTSWVLSEDRASFLPEDLEISDDSSSSG